MKKFSTVLLALMLSVSVLQINAQCTTCNKSVSGYNGSHSFSGE